MTTETQQTTPVRGYSATNDQLQARLKRIEGQVRGVQVAHCVIGTDDDIRADRTEELMAAVGRLLRRS